MASGSPRRTWPQRLTFVAVVVASIACFATAAGLATGQWVLSQRQLVEIDPIEAGAIDSAAQPLIILPGMTTTTTVAPQPGEPVTEVPLAEPDAANFLIVGADNGGCDDQAGTADRGDLGERSDTIMIWRANPETNQLAVLSFPRDLYVDLGGRRDRINTAYRRDDPTRLIETLASNFGVRVDHYVQVDFCAFRELVDAVGGVEVPFEYPARDFRAGLDIPEAGCVNLDGDMALAYVRSRNYQYENPAGSGNWTTDGTSDLGRIARQQDFLRRVVTKVIDDNLYNPNVATALITTNREFLVTDTGLTVNRMLEFASTLRQLDPATITTYRIESTSETLANGDKVERPRIGGENMRAILSVFRGEATLASAPDQVFEDTDQNTDADDGVAEQTGGVAEADGGADTGDDPDGSVTTTLPTIDAEENVVGIAPDRTAVCG